jgi:AcrR family transcriptional regulator
MAERADKDGTTAQDRLDRFLAEVADLAVDRDETMLWRREQRHLQEAEQKAFRAQFAAVRTRVVQSIAAAQSGTTLDQSQLLGYALLSMYGNTRDIRQGLTGPRLREVQSAIARSIIECDLPAIDTDARPAVTSTPRVPAGRRERIIDASARLFDERGFYDVRIDDIAKASGMSVATLYQHITGKAEVLHAILQRGAEGLLYVTTNALSTSDNPEQSLQRLIHTYIEEAFGVQGRTMRILSTDLIYLPEESQNALRDAQREYVAEWIETICALAPNLAPTDARALAHAVIGVITDMSQTPRVRNRPGVVDELQSLATAMVLPHTLVRS